MLKEKLLSIGGQKVANTFEEDLEKLLSRGFIFKPNDIEQLRMEQGRCHKNSAYYWKDKDRDESEKIATGWALLENGTWVQHSWIYLPHEEIILETTPNEYFEYYGFVLNKKEAEDFYWNNN